MTLLRKAVFLVALSCVPLMQAQSNSITGDIKLTFTTIDVPGGYVFNGISGINSAGVMVGSYSASNGSGLDKHGFTYSNGAFSYFDYPNAQSTFGSSINDSGLIVGSAYFEGGLTVHGFTYDGHSFVRFDAPGQPQTYPFGINNAGTVVGTTGDAGSVTKAFEMQNGVFTVVHVPGQSQDKAASGVNNFGDIAAYAIDGVNSYAYEDKHGRFQNLVFPGAPGTRALGINDGGMVVGVYYVSSFCYGFVFHTGKFISVGYPGAVCTGAEAINASGQIVGQYTFDYQSWHGFVTSPITSVDFEPRDCCKFSTVESTP